MTSLDNEKVPSVGNGGAFASVSEGRYATYAHGCPNEDVVAPSPVCGLLMGMETRAGQMVVRYVEHGTVGPVLVLHGAGVDHWEAEACVEPVLESVADASGSIPTYRGMGRTISLSGLRSPGTGRRQRRAG
jgi:hypothetical protein